LFLLFSCFFHQLGLIEDQDVALVDTEEKVDQAIIVVITNLTIVQEEVLGLL
jgi:hypothetical protein